MTAGPGVRRTGAAAAFALALVGLAAAAALHFPRPAVDTGLPLPWWALLLLYVVAEQVTLGFPRRDDSIVVSVVQLPLALGAVLVAPPVHLAVRLGTVVLDGLVHRRDPLKLGVNLGLAGLEVGLVCAVVGAAGPVELGPRLWGALLLGLLVADVVGQLVLHLVFVVLGMPRTRRDLVEPLASGLLVTVVFTGLAVLTIASASRDAWTLLAVLVEAAVLGLSYRLFRRISAQQRATEELYAFVKVLGPVDVDQPEALTVLEHVRELVHADLLELAVADRSGGLGRCLRVRRDGEAQVLARPFQMPPEGSDLRPEGMTTPLVVGDTFLGLLTAKHRVSSDRGFDPKDLRLLETVATELAIALDRGRLLRDLGQAALTDPMTGLPNLHQMTQTLDAMVARGEPVVLAAVAVDSFREVNDTLGHQVGNDLLREVARRLRDAAPTASLGRIGGGRFALAVPAGDTGDDAGLFGLHLRAQVEGGAQLGAVATHVRLSVGCVRAPEHGDDAATLLRRAETAMYGARSSHGGPVLWEPAYEVQGQRRLVVVMALREALQSGALGVAFQPKVSARTGQVTGAEALARWTHPALGEVPPTEFVPLAEATGLMATLTTTVLQQSLAACAAWTAAGRPIGVSVNVSADTLQDPAFVTEVAAALRASGVRPQQLTLELTEDVVVADPELATERMHELQALGLKLSVDDFGTGYSSLTYLKGLPVDEVKIDKGFVAGLVDDVADQAIVRAVVDIAHTLGVRVVAEGVEKGDQHDILVAYGVDEEQGSLHASPMTAPHLTAWLDRHETARPLT